MAEISRSFHQDMAAFAATDPDPGGGQALEGTPTAAEQPVADAPSIAPDSPAESASADQPMAEERDDRGPGPLPEPPDPTSPTQPEIIRRFAAARARIAGGEGAKTRRRTLCGYRDARRPADPAAGPDPPTSRPIGIQMADPHPGIDRDQSRADRLAHRHRPRDAANGVVLRRDRARREPAQSRLHRFHHPQGRPRRYSDADRRRRDQEHRPRRHRPYPGSVLPCAMHKDRKSTAGPRCRRTNRDRAGCNRTVPIASRLAAARGPCRPGTIF